MTERCSRDLPGERITITFTTENAAFKDGAGPSEIAWVLRQLAERSRDLPGPIRDSNGNTIGRCTVERVRRL